MSYNFRPSEFESFYDQNYLEISPFSEKFQDQKDLHLFFLDLILWATKG